MRRTPWFVHPIFVFVCSILALGVSLFLYIYWYIGARRRLEALVASLNIAPGQVMTAETWVVIVVLSLLVGLILFGFFTIFVYQQKTLQLYRLQHNFISSFTHELKTPVTSLKLFLETFIKHELPPEERRHYLQLMLRDVGRLSDTISRILNLARLESRSYQGHFVAVDLAAEVRQVCEANRALLTSCEVVLPEPLTPPAVCRVDRSLFEMLLGNLLANAVIYNRSQPPRIVLTIDVKGAEATLAVSDNGIGLERGEIPKIFKKFYQVGRSDDMSARGSGLGLYLVHTIARLHGGRVSAASKGLGQGATFSLTLPTVPGGVENSTP
jgi:signal transduction histidine kinase